eukprot:CAMPEP_0114662236 /NCGR_PEP_ID=MMETSP0191-20121206/24378_1 /TAXON_ID=126664 /ORGANISM="Sorites sp." /LENGTH=161 /DNA_ID=CAMNT_0001897721 /DNA_START=168 /DNA_END=649 /DNA_ORIENTATION=+
MSPTTNSTNAITPSGPSHNQNKPNGSRVNKKIKEELKDFKKHLKQFYDALNNLSDSDDNNTLPDDVLIDDNTNKRNNDLPETQKLVEMTNINKNNSQSINDDNKSDNLVTPFGDDDTDLPRTQQLVKPEVKNDETDASDDVRPAYEAKDEAKDDATIHAKP